MPKKNRGHFTWRPRWFVLLITLLVMGLALANVLLVQNKILANAEQNRLYRQSENIAAQIAQVNLQAEKMALQLVANEAVFEAFRHQDGTQLTELLPTVLKQWQPYGTVQLSLIGANGAAVWSSEAGIKSGDDLTFQRIVYKSLWLKGVVSAVETKAYDCWLVTTRPVFFNDEYIGLYKISLSVPYLGSQMSKSVTGKFALAALNGIDSTLLWQNQKIQLSLNTSDIKSLHDGEEIFRSLDRQTKILVTPLQDVDGITLAYIINQFSVQDLYQARLFNYIMLLLIFCLIVWFNYVSGKSRADDDHGGGNNSAQMTKIKNVAFNIVADQAPPYQNPDNNSAGK